MKKTLITILALSLILLTACTIQKEIVGTGTPEKNEKCFYDLKLNIDECIQTSKECLNLCGDDSTCNNECYNSYLDCRQSALNENNNCLNI